MYSILVSLPPAVCLSVRLPVCSDLILFTLLVKKYICLPWRPSLSVCACICVSVRLPACLPVKELIVTPYHLCQSRFMYGCIFVAACLPACLPVKELIVTPCHMWDSQFTYGCIFVAACVPSCLPVKELIVTPCHMWDSQFTYGCHPLPYVGLPVYVWMHLCGCLPGYPTAYSLLKNKVPPFLSVWIQFYVRVYLRASPILPAFSLLKN